MKKARLTPKQVAERWGCSTRLILDHIASGTIPAVNIGRKGSKKPRYRIAESDLAIFEANRTVRVVSAPTRRRKKNPNVIEFFLFLIGITATFATANDHRFRGTMNELDQQIIDATDIEAMVKEFYPADKLHAVNGDWYEVHALDREDKTPSVGINLTSGVYNDFTVVGGTSLYDWLVKTGHFTAWWDARNMLAKKAGIEIPKTKKQKKADNKERWEDLMVYAHFTLTENPLYTRGLCKRKQGITPESLEAFGGKAAKYNNIRYQNDQTSQEKHNAVVVIPIFNIRASRPDKSPISGAVILPNNGLLVYQPNDEAKPLLNRGTAGLVGKHGLEIITQVERRKHIIYVIKVEGISDALTLWARMDPEDREFFPVVTNSSGAGESASLKYWADLLLNLPVAIIHDSDKPGQEGVTNWHKLVGPSCSKFCNVIMHEEIVEKKGKDLRDWFNNGGTWHELKAMILSATPLEVSEREAVQNMTLNERTLFDIKCTVIGDLGGQKNLVQIYSGYRREYFEINPAYLNEFIARQMFGDDVGDRIDADFISIGRIKTAIAGKTAECGRVNLNNRIGPGIWCDRDKARLAIVGEQGLFVYDENGGLNLLDDPRFDGKAALLRTDDFTDPWFDYGKLAKYVRMGHDNREWSVGVLYELNNIFNVWDNLLYGSDDAFLLAGLTVATLLQDIWEIRPQVWLSGPTDSGKSHMTRVFEWMFGPLMARMDAPTEAGFRNAIQNQKRFCTIDEFEKSPHRKKIIETLRSTTKGGFVPRGTADHRSVLFKIKHLPWFTGTNRGFEEFAADSNRVIKIDLKGPSAEQYARGQVFPAPKVLRDLGHKLIAVAIVHWKKMLEMEAALSRLSIPGMAHRLIECYAVPTAVHAAVMNHDAKGAKKMLADMLEKRSDDVRQSSEADEERLLDFILTQQIRDGAFDYPLVELATDNGPFRSTGTGLSPRALAASNGVRCMDNGDWRFSEQLIQKQEWWRRSDYRKVNITEALLRLVTHSNLEADYDLRPTTVMVSKKTAIRTLSIPRADMDRFVTLDSPLDDEN